MRSTTARLSSATAAGAVVLGLLALGSGAAPAEAAALPAFTLAVYGDAPYGTSPSDTSEFKATPAFVDAVNADSDVSTVVHVGDIHSGKQYCTRSYDDSVAGMWAGFADPLVYTPGDNEWADCHKKGEGGGAYDATTGTIKYVKDSGGNLVDYAGGDPVANLDLVRQVFFPQAGRTLGRSPMQVTSQATTANAHDGDAAYVENVRWQLNGVELLTLNLPGGSNDDTDPWYGTPSLSQVQLDERAARDQADLDWIDAAFADAASTGARAVVVVEQADMWDLDGKPASHIANYDPFVRSLASHALAFGKPVLLLNGDSHSYRSDNPLSASAPCFTEDTSVTQCSEYANHPDGFEVPNFHRITVHGSTFPLEYLKLRVSGTTAHGPNSFGPFSWERVQPT